MTASICAEVGGREGECDPRADMAVLWYGPDPCGCHFDPSQLRNACGEDL